MDATWTWVDILTVPALWVSAGAFIATAVGAWKAYSASRKTLEYTEQQLEMAKESRKYTEQQLEMAKESRKEEAMRHRIATRDLPVSDMTKEMVELMLVMFLIPLTFRVKAHGLHEVTGLEVSLNFPHLGPYVSPEAPPYAQKNVKRSIDDGTIRSMFPVGMYCDALNMLDLYGMVDISENVYNLSHMGRILLGRIWEETPNEEEFKKLYQVAKAVYYEGWKYGDPDEWDNEQQEAAGVRARAWADRRGAEGR